jgi:hypothetical protein
MIGVVFFCAMMSLFLAMILHQEAKIFLDALRRAAAEDLPHCDTDVFPDECIHPFPDYIPPP